MIEVDGVTSGTITLDSADYASGDLVTEIQNKIDADGTLSAAGKSVVVSVDGGGKLVLTSTSTGSSSTVNVVSVDTDTLATLGLMPGMASMVLTRRPKVTIDTDTDTLVIELDGVSSGTFDLN